VTSLRPRVRGIDEELWFGDYSDAEAEKKAAESVAATVGRVVGAKPFPVAAQRLAEATRDPDCSLVQVVRILERDMALSARVLRLVNSASFALRTPCSSVRHAASLVGTQKLNQLATTAAILDMVDQTSVHASRILEHSAVVGGLCRYLGVHLGLPADELFTCGFLHDIGKLMLLEVEGKRYGDLLSEVGDEYDAIHLYERELFGFDHALLAGHVLSRWSIPDPVPKVVAWHHHVTRAYEEGPRWASMCSVLRLADLLSYALVSDQDEVQVERAARSESASYLDISAAQLAAVWDELRNLHERSRALFRGEEPPAEMPQVSLRPASRIGRPSASKSMRASHPSLRPPTLSGLGGPGAPSSRDLRSLRVAAPTRVTIQEAPEGPKQFPCVVCKGPSFANVCLACHGYVCPDHQRGPDDWCKLCRDEYVTESHGIRLRPILVLMLGAGLGATLVGAAVNLMTGHGYGSVAMLIGPLIGTGLMAGCVAIFHRYARRAWFLRTRVDRSVSGAAHISTPLPPDGTKEKDKEPDSGVRDSARPGSNAAPTSNNGFALTSESAPTEMVESIFARASGGDVVSTSRGRSYAPVAARDAAGLAAVLSSAPGMADALAQFSPRAFGSRAPSSAPGASVAPRVLSNAAPPSRQAASIAPSPSIVVGVDSMAGASVPPGSSAYPAEEAPHEAVERGRTLRLLSEHSSSAAPVRQAPAAAVSRAPSSSPTLSVHPLMESDARPLHFPDWSTPPPAPEGRGAASEASPATSAIVESTPTPAVAAAAPVAAVVAPAPMPEAEGVATDRSVAAQQQAWNLVLQATGTADGW
jgi:HD-like signal output (HDOD) protein